MYSVPHPGGAQGPVLALCSEVMLDRTLRAICGTGHWNRIAHKSGAMPLSHISSPKVFDSISNIILV